MTIPSIRKFALEVSCFRDSAVHKTHAGNSEYVLSSWNRRFAISADGNGSILLPQHKPTDAALLDMVGDLRDNILPELGLRVEDRQGEKAVIKLMDKDELLRERQQEREERDARERKKAEERAARVWIGLDWIGLDWIGLDWIGVWVQYSTHPSAAC
jgi:hypothetical protein